MINIDFNKLNINGPIVVGVSTGADSMALFHYLINNYHDKIICVHINHNVRKESATEEEYLINYCKKMNITLEAMKINEYNENNFENEARKKRYAFYEKILKKHNSQYLFLAHHADDLIETILMKIVRGSNINGYAGIKKIAKTNDYYIIRPFIDYTKEQLLEYINKNNIKYFDDVTNIDTNYTRNRFRHNIVPFLKNEDKNIHKKFIKYSNTLLEYNDYVEYEARKNLNNIYKENKLNISKFNNLHPFLKKNIIYRILNDIYNNKENIVKEQHINNILKLIENNKPNLTLALPNNISVIKEYNNITFCKKINKNTDYKIELNKNVIINNHKITIIKESDTDGNDICRLNSKDIKLPLYIRNKKNGDFIKVKGLNGKKKVKDIFIEKKVPKKDRETYPILVDSNDTILWIPNLKKSQFNNKMEEKCDIILKYCETKEEFDK